MMPVGHRLPIAQRFWKKVATAAADDCWLWTGSTDVDGYGLLWNSDGPPAHFRATHVSWKLHGRGDVPKGFQLCHSCDTPRCVNPAHLWVGTTQENTADRGRKGRTSRHSRIDPPRGEQHPMARLNETHVRAILALKHSGLRQRDIADRFGVSQANVWGILNRRIWKHVQ